jgi:hypothetical protein
MTKILRGFLVLLLSVSAFAETPFTVVVIDGYADYKSQVGGGHYELRHTDYFFDGNNSFKLLLDFAKKQNKFMTASQDEEVIVDIVNPRQLRIQTDLEEQYVTLPKGSHTVVLKTQKGKITLQLEVVSGQ